MTVEVLSSEVVSTMEYLRTEIGFKILPKRLLVIPKVSPARVGTLATLQGREMVAINLRTMQHFLDTPAFADKFDRDHTARRRWQEQGLPGLDSKVCMSILDRNQLRVGVWQNVAVAFTFIQESLRSKEFPEYAVRLKEIRDEIVLRIYGQDPKTKEKIAPDYAKKSTDGKLADIQLLEDRALEVLGWFAEPSEKQDTSGS